MSSRLFGRAFIALNFIASVVFAFKDSYHGAVFAVVGLIAFFYVDTTTR